MLVSGWYVVTESSLVVQVCSGKEQAFRRGSQGDGKRAWLEGG